MKQLGHFILYSYIPVDFKWLELEAYIVEGFVGILAAVSIMWSVDPSTNVAEGSSVLWVAS